MSFKRNRLDAGYELEPRVMLSGSIPGAEAPVSNETEAPVEETAAEEVVADEAIADEAIAEETPVEDAVAEVAPEEAAPEEVVAEEVVAEEEVAEEVVADEVVVDEVVAEEVVADEVVADEVVADEVVADEVVAEEVVAEEVVAEEVFVEEVVADEVVAEEVVADEVVAEEVVADEVVAEEVVADEVVAEEVVVDEVVAEEVVAEEVVVDEVIAEEVVAEEVVVEEVVVEEVVVAETGVVVDGDAIGAVVNNEPGESITSAQTAVEVNGEATINNGGEIAGGVNGVNFAETGTGTLNNAGIVSSDSRAVQINGDGVEINNEGAIVGTDDQRNGTVYSNRTADDFTINNNGLIDAGEGNEGAGISTELVAEGTTFDINNNGLVQGRGNAAAGAATAGDGVRLERTRVAGALDGTTTGLFDGTINNNGLIDSEGDNGTVAGFRAVNGVDFQGELNNNGLISGTQNGVYFGNATPAGGGNNVGGVVNNNGAISSDSRAFNVDGTGLEINNNGSIIGTDDQRNGTFYADSTAQDFTLNNNGLIDAGEGNLGAGFSVELDADGNTFEIDNTGQIQGRGDAAAGTTAAGDGVRLERTRVAGALDGTTTGLFDGTINNSGLIDSEGDNGTVAGFRAVNGVDFQGELNNDGTISGTQNGVYFGNATAAGGGNNVGGVVNNSGVISSDSRAFNIDGTGLEINNSGSIIATDSQRNGTVYADSTAQDFTLNNTGLIDAGSGLEGAGFSVELAETGNDFTINNDGGAILGRGDAAAGVTAAGDGIRLERTRVAGALDGSTTGLFTGTIDNSGLVSSEGDNGTVGGFRAVDGVDFQGTLDNSGTITGVRNGVYFGDGDHTGGVVNNSGTISSDSRSVNIDGDGLVFNNFGLVEATDRQRNGTVYADATADNFEINNSGRIDAGPGAGSGVSIQVGSEAGDVQTASITNSGEIFGAGDTELDAGVRLFTSVEGETTFSGDIVNSGTITSETAAAILVEDGVQFDGDFINSGVIDGEIDLSSGDVVLTDESVVYLDIAGVDQVEQIDTEGDVTFGGTLNVRFEEGFVPEAGQSFDLIDFGAAEGSFTSVQSDVVEFDTSNLVVDGTVVVIGGVEVEVGEEIAAELAAATDAGEIAELSAELVADVVAAVEAETGVAPVLSEREVRQEARTTRRDARDVERTARRDTREVERSDRDESRTTRRDAREVERASRDESRETRSVRRASTAEFNNRGSRTY